MTAIDNEERGKARSAMVSITDIHTLVIKEEKKRTLETHAAKKKLASSFLY